MAKIIPYNPKLKTLAKELRKKMTLGEVLLWNELKENKMLACDFDRQRCLDEYIVDFYCKDLMLAIEIDGMSHNGEEASAKDEIRQQRLERLGIVFLRFSEREVKYDTLNVLRAIEGKVIEIFRKDRTIEPPKGFNLELLKNF